MSRPPERIAWTRERAAAEWGINPRTLAARLKQTGLEPDKAGRWTTKQIDTAINGSLELERIRKTSAEAHQIEKENLKSDAKLVDVDDFCKIYESIYVGMKSEIMASKLSEKEKESLLTKLSELHQVKF
jgi:hypothetical protein